MFNAEELTNRLFDIAEFNGFSRTPEITAYIDSLVTKAKDNVDPTDDLYVYRQTEPVLKDYLRIQKVRKSAKANVLRWLNTAEEILVKDVEPGNYSLANRIEIAKMLQLDEIRCDQA
jgi:hypothetical protein